jgi:hypothetical protein
MEIKKDEAGNDIEPTAEELKAEIARIEADNAKIAEERENYKKGLLEREDKLKALKDSEVPPVKKEGEEEEEQNNWDEASTKFQNETITKAAKLAEEAASKVISAREGKTAMADFRESHPEVTDEQWEKIVLNYTPTDKGYKKDLERAFVLERFDSGEVIDPAQIQAADARTRLLNLNGSAGAGGSGRYEENKKGLSEGAVSIGSRMRVSEEDLKKEDDSLSAEIKIS